jgi:hypothetical protein
VQGEIGRFFVGRNYYRGSGQNRQGESDTEHIACVPQVGDGWQVARIPLNRWPAAGVALAVMHSTSCKVDLQASVLMGIPFRV